MIGLLGGQERGGGGRVKQTSTHNQTKPNQQHQQEISDRFKDLFWRNK